MRLTTLSTVQLPSHSMRVLWELLLRHGLRPDETFAEAGVGRRSVHDPTATVSGTEQITVQRAFVRRTLDDPTVWTFAALAHTLPTLGLLGLAHWTAPDLVAWCGLLKFEDFHYGLARHHLLREGDGTPCGVEFVWDDDDLDLGRFYLVLDFVSVVKGLEAVWGGPFPFRRLEYPADVSTSLLAAVGGDAVPTTGTARLLWSAHDSRRPLPAANPALHRYYVQQLQRRSKVLNRLLPLRDRVEVFLSSPGNQARSIDETAAALGTSVRTMQRQLQLDRTSYRELQSAARRTAAATMLTTTDRSIAAVADTLGYADLSSFSRAFSSWYGTSPSGYRQAVSPSHRGRGTTGL
ncbi:helix-turn-helix domain-containing protein [Streptomyces sp. NPDC097610]|uniref:helix-turn-helix domain-containing protein n=1 Tax=Streptomyces sp. NPDC097610 TaxID=3157227 RepID=UPI00333006C7